MQNRTPTPPNSTGSSSLDRPQSMSGSATGSGADRDIDVNALPVSDLPVNSRAVNSGAGDHRTLALNPQEQHQREQSRYEQLQPQRRSWFDRLMGNTDPRPAQVQLDSAPDGRWHSLFEISARLRNAGGADVLLDTTVSELHRHLRCDRVLAYQFTGNDRGVVLAEAMTVGFTPTRHGDLPAVLFGAATRDQYARLPIVDLDVRTSQLSPYQEQLLAHYQVQSSLCVPIHAKGQIWGLLVVQQCAAPREWIETDVALVYQTGTELMLGLQPMEYQVAQKERLEQDKLISKLTATIQQTADPQAIFRAVTQDLRQVLRADRAVVYQFYEDWSGEVVAESVGSGWNSLIELQQTDDRLKQDLMSSDRCVVKHLDAPRNPEADTFLQDTQGGLYSQGKRYSSVEDIYEMGFSDCYLESLEKFQCRAYLNVPVFSNGKLWGLLAIYQNSGPRQWGDDAVTMAVKVSKFMGIALEKASTIQSLESKASQEAVVAKLVARIQASSLLPDILRTVTQGIRELLNCDRAGIFQFNPDWSGELIAESVGKDWPSMMQLQMEDSSLKQELVQDERCLVKGLGATRWPQADTYLKDTQGGEFTQGKRYSRVDNIYTMGFSDCYLESLEKFQCKAYTIVPLFQGNTLWGLMAAYQNDGPRKWGGDAVKLMLKLSEYVAIAIQKAENVELLEDKLQQEQLVNRLVAKVQQADDTDSIFKAVTADLRLLLDADRVGIYRFYEDWSGEFVAESVGQGWTPVVELQEQDDEIRNELMDSDRCLVKSLTAPPSYDTDTYLKDTEGGMYVKGQRFSRVDDVDAAGFSDCYLATLRKFQCRAYLNVPIFNQGKLWGLLAVYQNSGPRTWTDDNANLLMQVSRFLAIGLERVENIERLQRNARQEQLIAAIAERLRLANDFPQVLRTVVQDVRQLLDVDRVGMYRFLPESKYSVGKFVVEDVSAPHYSAMDAEIEDHCFPESQAGAFSKGKTWIVNDVQELENLQPCLAEILDRLQIRASMVMPLMKGDILWGLFCTHQCRSTRQWRQEEQDFVSRIAIQLNIALQQEEYLDTVRSQSEKLAQSAQREKAAKERLQQEAIQLLTAVRPALQGDLTVRVPLTETEIGTIASAFNSTLQGLRAIVAQVKEASGSMAETSQVSWVGITKLASDAEHQYDAIGEAMQELEANLTSAESVASSARQVKDAVEQANETVQAGDTAMNRTVTGISTIRATVSETSKRIKRLSESSMKISKVVNLIENFTNQTHLLSLNAAIEATRAGDYGRGFAVVADEVRSLARQSASATTEIAQLVQEIQEGTVEVANAMDEGIQQVVEGTNLVADARNNLSDIIQATEHIRQLSQQIEQATQKQTEQSKRIAGTMTEVAQIASQTSEDSSQLSVSFQQVLDTAKTLRTHTGQFKIG
ncbi:MAG: GAF domain-containing protein [Cyanobacteria bacterium P01_E01_bin.45]